MDIIPKKGVVGKIFKKNAEKVYEHLSQMDESDIARMEALFAETG